MPEPSLIASTLAGVGGNVLGTIAGGLFGQSMADRQWNKQNAYNTPKAQMERLKAAGLNPNLVYGNGSVANTADAPKVAEVKESDMGSRSIAQYTDLKQKALQNDILEKQAQYYDAQIRNIDSEISFREGERTTNLQSGTQRNLTETEFKKLMLTNENQRFTVDQQGKKQQILESQKRIENMEQQMRYYPKIVQNQLRQGVSRIAQMDVNTQQQQIEKELKQMQSELRKNGVEVNDNLIMRLIAPALGWSKQQWSEILKNSKWKF